MAKSWKSFMKGLEARAKAEVPEEMETLHAIRDHYKRLGAELAQERKKLGMSQDDFHEPF